MPSKPPLPTPTVPDYLKPYAKAAQAHGGAFPSLLWASTETQSARFQAFADAAKFKDATVLDVGCGRADLLDFLVARNERPKEYIGIEAVPELASAAERAQGVTRIIRGDFITNPRILFTASDIIALSGSLNTAKDVAFYDTLKRCYDATAITFAFNFLSSPYLAGAAHLYWREPKTVEKFCRQLSPTSPPRVRLVTGYLQGDATIILDKG